MTSSLIMPVLDLLHPDLVDAEGNLMDGQPRPGLFAARASLPIHTHGFIYPDWLTKVYEAQPDFPARKFGYERAIFEKLKLIIRDVSQKGIGPDLLANAYRQGTTISYDPAKLAQINARAGYNSTINAIALHSDFPRAILNLELIHELEHAAHVPGGIEETANTALNVKIFNVNAVESAARTMVVVYVYQNELPCAEDKPWHYKVPGLMEALEIMDPYMAVQGKKFAYLAKKEDWTGFAAELFKAASFNLGRKADYENGVISQTLMDLQERLRDATNPPNLQMMTDTKIDLEKAASSFKILGQQYVKPEILKQREFHQLSPVPIVSEIYKNFIRKIRQINKDEGLKLNGSVPRADLIAQARTREYARQYAAISENERYFYSQRLTPIVCPEVTTPDAVLIARHVIATAREGYTLAIDRLGTILGVSVEAKPTPQQFPSYMPADRLLPASVNSTVQKAPAPKAGKF